MSQTLHQGKRGSQRIAFGTVLCPLDLTLDSERALRYAVAIAQAFEARLMVCHCLPTADGVTNSEACNHLNNAVQQYLRPTDGRLKFGWEAKVYVGNPAEAIPREAARSGVDLIVMRSRRRPHAAALLGSTAESVCRTAPCPVLVTHQMEREWAGMSTNEVGLERVLVAYDFSGDSELALAYGLSLAQEYQSELHLLHVLPPRARTDGREGTMVDSAVDDGPRTAAVKLQRVVPAEAALWCNLKQAVREGHVYREVLDYAEERSVDLICMGASGTGFGMRALFGSNADRVLRQADCPVLIARPLRPIHGGEQ